MSTFVLGASSTTLALLNDKHKANLRQSRQFHPVSSARTFSSSTAHWLPAPLPPRASTADSAKRYWLAALCVPMHAQ